MNRLKFFTNAVYTHKWYSRKGDSQRQQGESPSRTNISNLTYRSKIHYLGHLKTVQNMLTITALRVPNSTEIDTWIVLQKKSNKWLSQRINHRKRYNYHSCDCNKLHHKSLSSLLYLLYAWRLMIVSNGEDDGYKKALATLKTIFIVALIIFLFLMIIYQLINDLG